MIYSEIEQLDMLEVVDTLLLQQMIYSEVEQLDIQVIVGSASIQPNDIFGSRTTGSCWK